MEGKIKKEKMRKEENMERNGQRKKDEKEGKRGSYEGNSASLVLVYILLYVVRKM